MSSEHSKVESISFALNVKFAIVAAVTASGFWLMNVSGGTATDQRYSAGVSSESPSGLRAATSNVCSSSIRLVYVFGEEQSVSSAPSSAQKKTELALVGGEVERRASRKHSGRPAAAR